MGDAAAGLLSFAAVAAAFTLAVHQFRRGRARTRLETRAGATVPRRTRRLLVPSYRALAFALGGLAGALLAFWWTDRTSYVFAFGGVGAALALVGEDLRVERRLLRVEADLADAVDLLVGALRAGAGLGAAIDASVPNLPLPLRSLFEEMGRRLRLGDEPARIFAEPADRVPLPSFQLFALSLGTQWEAGGNLAPALALVGRSIRDRVALVRRVGTQSTSALASVVGIAIITYGIGGLMWLWEPRQVEVFLATVTGSVLVSGALLLQAFGLLWIRSLVRIRA
ncbi:MAG: type II secretion system F family protein [Proteobacteria bacterium]|nr:type II secretion system F family protein [Pseudomonadota bacterium]